jgi:ABC-type sugar transport system ATPase subunit
MLSFKTIDKDFGATRAVINITLDAAPGTVLGLVGENGAGKSTLIKIAGGIVRQDRGLVSLDGEAMVGVGPAKAIARGVVSVFQELTLVRSLTVAENLFLSAPPRHAWGSIDRCKLQADAQALLEGYHVGASAAAVVAGLPLGQQQMVEIIRAVHREPRVLLLDEATAALGAAEVEWLMRIVEAERKRGTIILFISHRWEEITAFCQRVAVMRNGELVTLADVDDISHDRAVELMTGARLGGVFPRKQSPAGSSLLEARGLVSDVLHGVDLRLAKGEILGIGGLVGQGQDALLKSLFGDHPLRAGAIFAEGSPMRLKSPREAIARHIAYVPQERKIEGLLLQKSVAANLSFAILRRISRLAGFINRRAERRIVGAAINRLKIRASSNSQAVGALSGGNQQKVLLQKWLLTNPTVLLLNDVTRGVDIGTKTQIYAIITELAASGMGIVLYSTDAHELTELAHRVSVMIDGRIKADLAGDQLTAEGIVRASTSAEDRRAAAP